MLDVIYSHCAQTMTRPLPSWQRYLLTQLNPNENLFEVGGESKTTRQIQDAQQPAYLAIDNIEHGRGQRIPLWLFGFLY